MQLPQALIINQKTGVLPPTLQLQTIPEHTVIPMLHLLGKLLIAVIIFESHHLHIGGNMVTLSILNGH